MDRVDVTIIGAGVVGLAVAARLSQEQHRSVALLEKLRTFGQETSSRNSEVIHSGIYYPPGSWKARLCVEGNRSLYAFCAQHKVPHARLGKIVVAVTPEETAGLERLERNGRENGVAGLELLDGRQVAQLEPAVRCLAGLLSPHTGILDTHRFMHQLSRQAHAQGALLTYGAEVTGLEKTAVGYRVFIGQEQYPFETRVVVNCAGLFSDRIARLAGLDVERCGYKLHFCKGDYFRSHKKTGVQRLIYPVPVRSGHGLGIHLTHDLAGHIRIGPDTEYVGRLEYTVDESKKTRFCEAVRAYLPGLKDGDFHADTSGIRPKLQGPADPVRDFVVRHEADQGLPGFINLIGIESPGLTSSLALAEAVEQMVKEYGEN